MSVNIRGYQNQFICQMNQISYVYVQVTIFVRPYSASNVHCHKVHVLRLITK